MVSKAKETLKYLAIRYEISKSNQTELNIIFEELDRAEECEKYKTFENELGISLSILVDALKNGIWVKTKNGIFQHFTVSIRKWLQTNTYCLYYRPYTHVLFKDYGKTWALTKEELL